MQETLYVCIIYNINTRRQGVFCVSEQGVFVGACIRRFRRERGLSVRDLARKANITPSMLSQIERDLVNPSINTLKTLSVELDVPIYRFFVEEDKPQENLVVRSGERKTIGDPSINISYDLLTPDVRGSIEFCIMHVPFQEVETPFSLSHEGEEVAYVLSGKTDLVVNSTRYTLAAGDSIRIPPYMKHYWANTYEGICDVIFAITPPSF